jgi:Fe-S cluster assembly iron-binding protein IscA
MVLTVTDAARDKILELRAQEDDPDTLGLRIEVTGCRASSTRTTSRSIR